MRHERSLVFPFRQVENLATTSRVDRKNESPHPFTFAFAFFNSITASSTMNTSATQWSFEDFLNIKTPTTASGNDSSESLSVGSRPALTISFPDSLAFSLIPPTPQELRNRPFPSPYQFASSVGSGLPFELASPPPYGGIMSPKHESAQSSSLRPQSGFRTTYTAEHRRSFSITSQGHRHEPYKTASRQSSISSLSAAMPVSDGNSSDWQSQWESTDERRQMTDREAYSASPLSNAGLSICPADLQVKPAALRLQRSMPSYATQVPLPKVEYGEDGDSDAFSEMGAARDYSRKPRANVPAPIIPTKPYSHNGKAGATAGTTWSRSSGVTRNSRQSNPQKSYREDPDAPESPILVTAITSSGKKSHARKVGLASLVVSYTDALATPLSDRKTISLVRAMPLSCSENTSWTRN